ncbi:tetratricopeptide repeat protein [Morganella morganii]|uniref:tetratricopeptide repeat protein n=1 Tax=Morganella morganii TaxID=582 RepID=UPI001E4DC749|nr:tetratricopeptide repeat protein [Morganella morganii]UFH68799.1 sel1 repeat family protein [Morganella morganii]
MILAYKLRSRLRSVIFSVFLMMAGSSYASEIVKPETIDSECKPTDIADNRSVVLKANALIQLQIGLLYEEGIGFPQNSVFARYWFEKAAEQNNADALFYLGSYYLRGIVVNKDEERGISLYRKAAGLGSSGAMNSLGLYAKKEKQTKEAILLYQQAIASGSDVALLNLGAIYHEIGNYDESEKILLLALNKDNKIKSEALNKLGGLYYEYNFEKYSINKAEKYYLESILLGNEIAMSNLGMLYVDLEEYQKAFHYFKLSADKGFYVAINNLGSLYRYGYGVKQDYTKALSLFQRAAELGSSSGLYNIASMYEKGEGVKQDDNKAIEYYEKALAAGHYPAQERIDFLKAKHKK